MISYEEALALLLGAVSPLPGERVSLADAMGRTLAQPVLARIDAPRHDVSAMDGYAVRIEDARRGGWLDVRGASAPGSPFAGTLGPSEAIRIFTGAHVPKGADCVVIQEEAVCEGNRVRFRDGFGPAVHIRLAGSDFANGESLLDPGTRLTPGAMVALAGSDHAEVAVARRPLVSLIATGDELVVPGRAAGTAHSIPDSGSFGVSAIAVGAGALLVGHSRGRDRLEELEQLATKALEQSDLVIVLGGASVGDRDLAKPMFDHLGIALQFSKVAIQPGKPVWFAKAGERYVLGLPGNPGSAMVTARLFLVPLLAAMQGGSGHGTVQTSPQRLAADLPPTGARETFARARMGEDGLHPVANQVSGAQAPLAQSDWLIRRKANDGPIAAGETVRALPF